MRTLTTPESQLLQGDHVQVRARVQVKDADGVFKNLSAVLDPGSTARDWLLELQWEDDIDTAVAQATVTLIREASGQSLAPMLTASTLNRKAGGAYAPLLDAGREAKIEVATVSVATATPAAGDWKLLFHGDIDEVDWGKGDSRVQLTIRDLGGRLQDRFIETKKDYVPTGSAAVETVMQQILTDNNTGVTLYTPASPGWMIGKFSQEQEPVLDALRKLAEQIGWDVRYRWNASQSRFDLTFYQPPRGKVTADWSIGPRQYLDVSNLAVNRAGVRNVVKVNFLNAATGLKDAAVDQDLFSIARYGRRFMELVETEAPLIDTTAEAQTLAGRILSDLKDPLAEQEVEMHFFWPVELGDLYAFQPNAVHYDTAQSWAVVGYRHQLGAGQWRTTLTTRGTVAGAYRDWLRHEIRVTGPDEPAEVTWKTEVTENAAGTVGTLKLTVSDPSSLVQQVQFYLTEGGAARTAYTITAGAGGVYQRDVALHPKHLAVVEPVITLKDGRILQPGSETFDTGSLPDVLAVLPEVGDTGAVAVTARGDSDTRSFRVAARTDRFPTLAEAQAATAFPSGGVAARETVAASVVTLGVGQTAYVGVVAYSGVSGTGNASALATEQVTRIERVPPTLSVRVANNANRDAADLFVTVESVIGEQVRLHFKDVEGSSTAWSLVNQADNSARWVNSGTVLGPTDWFHSGATAQQKLAAIALSRDQVKRVLVQAESRSGAKSTWVSVTLDVKEQPWLESVTMTFNDATDQLEMTAVGGAFTRSARFEFSATEAFSAVLGPQTAALVDGGKVTVTYAVGALRDRTLYGRVTPFNGVLVDTNADGVGDTPSGINGPPQLVNAYVPPPDPPLVFLSLATTGRVTATTVTLTAALGAGAQPPLQYRHRVLSDEGTVTTNWTAWNSYSGPVNLNVSRHPYWEQTLQVEVRDGDLRTTADEWTVYPSRPGTGTDGGINRTHPISGTTSEFPFSTADRLATGLEPQADIAGINAHVVSRSQHGVFLETFEQAPADWTTLWNFRSGNGTMLSLQSGSGVAGGKVLRATGGVWISFKRNLAFDPSKLYRMRVRARMVTDPTSGGKNFYAGVEGVAADGSTLVNVSGNNTSASQHYVAASSAQMTAGGAWTEFTGWFRGLAAAGASGTGVAAPDPTAPGTLHAAVRYIRPLLILNNSAGNGVMEVDEIALDVQDEDALQRTYRTLKSGGRAMYGGTTVDDPDAAPRELGDVARRAGNGLDAAAYHVVRTVPLAHLYPSLPDINSATGLVNTVGGEASASLAARSREFAAGSWPVDLRDDVNRGGWLFPFDSDERDSRARVNDAAGAPSAQIHPAGRFGRALAVEEATTNLVAGTNGRPGAVAVGGTSAPTAAVVATDNPFGTEAHRFTFSKTAALGYAGSRATFATFTQASGTAYSVSVWLRVAPHLAQHLTLYVTGTAARPPLARTGRRAGDWEEWALANDTQTSGAAYTQFLTIYLSSTPPEDVTVDVAAHQVEAKSHVTTYVEGSRAGSGYTRYPGLAPNGWSEFTLGAWTRCSLSTGVYRMIAGTWGKFYFAWHLSAQQLIVSWMDAGTQKSLVSTAVGADCTQWNHCAFSYSRAARRLRIFLNGVKVGEAASVDMNTAPGEFSWGGIGGGSTLYPLRGLLDDAFILAREASEDELRAICNADGPLLDTHEMGEGRRRVDTLYHSDGRIGPVVQVRHPDGSDYGVSTAGKRAAAGLDDSGLISKPAPLGQLGNITFLDTLAGKLKRTVATADGGWLVSGAEVERAAGDGGSRVFNGSFEVDTDGDGLADGWTGAFETANAAGTFSLSATASDGARGQTITPANASSGTSIACKPFTVREGEKFRFLVDVHNPSATELDSLYFRVLWYSDGPSFARNSAQLVSMVDLVNGSQSLLNPSGWTTFSQVAQAPVGARWCRVALYCWNQRSGAALTFDRARAFSEDAYEGRRKVETLSTSDGRLLPTVDVVDHVTGAASLVGDAARRATQGLAVGSYAIAQAAPLDKLSVLQGISQSSGLVDPSKTYHGSTRTPGATDLDARQAKTRRGPNLVVNGDAEEGTNLNFPLLGVVESGAAPSGRYLYQATGSLNVMSDELIPVDPAQLYGGGAMARRLSGTASLYIGLACYDRNQQFITPENVYGYTASLTTLAQAAAAGATQVVLADGTNWGTGGNSFIAFNALADGSDRPNYSVVPFTARSGNTLTLQSPLPQGYAAGTPVRFHISGGTYNYVFGSATPAPLAWTQFRGTIGGENGVGELPDNKFRYGTRYVRFMVLANWGGASSDVLQLDRMELAPLSFVEDAAGVVSGKEGRRRVDTIYEADGILKSGTNIFDTATVARNVARGVKSGSARHGVNVAFIPPFQAAPAISFGPGGITYHATVGSAKSQTQIVEAVNPSASGFTLRAVIREIITGTLVARQVSFSSPGGTPQHQADKGNTAEAYDDRYTYVYTVVLHGSSGAEEPM